MPFPPFSKDMAGSDLIVPYLEKWRAFFEREETPSLRAEVRNLWLTYRASGRSPYREPEIWYVPGEWEQQNACHTIVTSIMKNLTQAGETGFLVACVEATGVVTATAHDKVGMSFTERPFGLRPGVVLSFPPYPATAYTLAQKEGMSAWLIGAEHPHVAWHRTTSLAIPFSEVGKRILVVFFREYPPIHRIVPKLLAVLTKQSARNTLEPLAHMPTSPFTALHPLFSFLAHEIFNPLTHIRGFLELHTKSGEREALLRDAAHIERTLRAFLLLSEPVSGGGGTVIDFRALPRAAVDQAARISPLALALPQKPLLIRGDLLRLETGLHLALTWLQMLGDPFPSLVSGTKAEEAFLRLGGTGPVPRILPSGETPIGQRLEAEEILFVLANRLLTEGGAHIDPPEAEGGGWRVTFRFPLVQEPLS